MAITPRGCDMGTRTFPGLGEVTGRWFRPNCADQNEVLKMPIISCIDAEYDPYTRRGVRAVMRGNSHRRFAIIDSFRSLDGRGYGKRVPAQFWVQLYDRGPKTVVSQWGDNMPVYLCPLWTEEEDIEFARSWDWAAEGVA